MKSTSQDKKNSTRSGSGRAGYFFGCAACLFALLLLAGISVPAVLQAGPLDTGIENAMPAPGSVGERFGAASSHIKLWDAATQGAELDAMADAGIGWLRCDFAWADLEPSPGAWDFSGTDRVVAEAEARGIKVLGILGTSPSWANGGQAWNWPPTDIPAWQDYVYTVCYRYRGRVSAWEVWNEQNIDTFWQPEPDAAAYVNLLAAASPRIRAADPAATVVMGGVAGLGWPDLVDYLSLGAAAYIDALAYHPYAETIGVEGQPEEDLLRPKEGLCRTLLDWVRWLINQYTNEEIEIWLTEVGWTNCAETPPGVDEETQAAYLLRTMLNYASTDVERVVWYNLRDTLLNDMDRYGLVAYDFTPKPSYGCFKTFLSVFGPAAGVEEGAATFSCASPATLESHAFRLPDGGLALAAWKSDDAADTLTVTVPGPVPSLTNPVLVDPFSGEESPAPGASRDAGGNITVSGLAIGKIPVILRLDKVSVTSITPHQGNQYNIVLAISDLAGSGFRPGAQVRLEMDGNVINAYDVNVVSPTQITCTVGLFGVATGFYDVVVTNPDGSWARLEDGFRVLTPCGTGSSAALLALGMLGLVSAAGALRLRRPRRG